MRVIQKIRDAIIDPFVLFTLSIFLKSIFFHYSCYNYVAVSSLWQSPLEFFAFYFAKLLPALFFASFVFLAKRKWWTIIASVLIDLWLIANEIYYKINGLFLDYDTISFVSNLRGFGDSIVPFLSWSPLVYLFITVCYIVLLCVVLKKVRERNFKKFLVSITASILLIVYDCVLGYGRQEKFKEGPWQTAVGAGRGLSARTLNGSFFVERGSGLHYILCYPAYSITRMFYEKKHGTTISINDEKIIRSLIANQDTSNLKIEDRNIVVIIVESLESWVLSIKDTIGNQVTPNLCKFSQRDNSVLFTKIKSEARGGSSGDGQMIINTGLLPISSGAACMLYGNNVFPNYAHFFQNTFVVDACCGNVWNQLTMSKAYSYNENIPRGGNSGGDDWVANLLLSVLDTIKQPFCCQTITISTHTPFTSVDSKSMRFSEEMPTTMNNYLQSFHFADSCIGIILDGLEKRALLDSTIVIITGDHTIFKKSMLQEFQSFSEKYNYPIPSDESYCPLIIYSPKIKERLEINDLCYQMDIFPTILHCIGADDYYWKGFGVNLLDSAARHNRKITEDEAYILSDKMIRSDYFRGIGE